jgi:tRNA pseudouridine38-40 synthase
MRRRWPGSSWSSAGSPEATRTLRLQLAYDGTSFRGWARQGDPEIRTVEGVLVEVLSTVLREPVRLSVAGRTDAGVHARGQVVSFVTERGIRVGKLQGAINGHLGPEVVAFDVAEVPASFDARFSASAREYRYSIDTASLADPFTVRFLWHRPGDLDIGAMRSAASHLVGEHDFTTFCRHPGAQKSTVRHLQRLSVRKEGTHVDLGFRANAFLHQMVRAAVGTLVLVGEGQLDPDDVARLLAQRSRAGTGNLAPARGLTLERVVYGRRVF